MILESRMPTCSNSNYSIIGEINRRIFPIFHPFLIIIHHRYELLQRTKISCILHSNSSCNNNTINNCLQDNRSHYTAFHNQRRTLHYSMDLPIHLLILIREVRTTKLKDYHIHLTYLDEQ